MGKIIVVVVVLALIAGAAALGMGIGLRGPRVDQPIAFNHAVHIEDASLECIACHQDAPTSTFAGIPSKTVCLDCHDSEDEAGDNPEKDKLFAFEDEDTDIPWRRVTLDRPDVFFSHRRHVTAAKLECTECHRDQKSLTAPPRRVHLVLTMTECVQCHAEHGMPEDCIRCHR